MAVRLAHNQIASLDHLIEAEPDAGDVVFGPISVERRIKTVMPFDDGSTVGNWIAQPWTVVRDGAGRVVAEFPETVEFSI